MFLNVPGHRPLKADSGQAPVLGQGPAGPLRGQAFTLKLPGCGEVQGPSREVPGLPGHLGSEGQELPSTQRKLALFYGHAAWLGAPTERQLCTQPTASPPLAKARPSPLLQGLRGLSAWNSVVHSSRLVSSEDSLPHPGRESSPCSSTGILDAGLAHSHTGGCSFPPPLEGLCLVSHCPHHPSKRTSRW